MRITGNGLRFQQKRMLDIKKQALTGRMMAGKKSDYSLLEIMNSSLSKPFNIVPPSTQYLSLKWRYAEIRAGHSYVGGRPQAGVCMTPSG